MPPPPPPLDPLEYQLSNISVLQSMYPSPTELRPTPSSLPILRKLQTIPTTPLAPEDERVEYIYTSQIAQGRYDMVLALPLKRARLELSLRQPEWLTRSEWESVRNLDPSIDEELVVEYLLECKDLIRRRIESLPKYQLGQAGDVKPDIGGGSGGLHSSSVSVSGPGGGDGQIKSCLERVWFWFPSLSSKEKRRDLVTFAEEHLLSGFLLAGKPGLLCVEGCGKEVDRYMSRIKSESWSDIPPHQKKVTERLRRSLHKGKRTFQDMSDITDQISKYGQYNHRGEMSEVKRLMDVWGVGDDFQAVVMNASKGD